MGNLTPKIVFLLRKNNDAKGFTLTENLVALMVLTVTLSSMFPGFMNFSVENSKHRILSGAIGLANNQLENLRRQNIEDFTLGLTSLPTRQNSGYTYNMTQYICTSQPTNISSTTPTCSTTVDVKNSSRYILIKVLSQTNENVYSVQTVFTKLR